MIGCDRLVVERWLELILLGSREMARRNLDGNIDQCDRICALFLGEYVNILRLEYLG